MGIIGPNGAGKTTLLKIMLGLLEGYEGSVRVMGMSPAAACRRGAIIGYVPQQRETELRFPVTVRQVVRMGLVGKTGLFRRYARDDLAYVEQLMERVGIAALADRPIGDLSGGQQQRPLHGPSAGGQAQAADSRRAAGRHRRGGQRQFAELSHDLHRSLDLTLVIVSHDLRAIATGCTRVACLNQTIHYHDSPAGLTEDVLGEVFEHEISWRCAARPPRPTMPAGRRHELTATTARPRGWESFRCWNDCSICGESICFATR